MKQFGINQINAILDGALSTYRLLFTFEDSTTLEIQENRILASSFWIDSSATDSGEFELGNTQTTELTVGLLNIDNDLNEYVFEGSSVTAFVSTNTETGLEESLLGTWVVDERPKRGNVITIKALDYMARTDVEWTPSAVDNTPLKIIQSALSYSGVTYKDGQDLPPNANTTLAMPEPDSDHTAHQWISWACAVMGVQGTIDEHGHFVYSEPFDTELEFGEESNDIISVEYGEKDVRLTGIDIDRNEEEINTEGETVLVTNKYTLGAIGYTVDMTSNLVAQAMTNAELLTTVQSDLFYNYQTRPVTYLTIRECPFLQPMDRITVNARGETFSMLILEHKLIAGGSSQLACNVMSETQSGYATGSALTSGQLAKIQAMNQRYNWEVNKTRRDMISSQEQARLELLQAVTNGMGMYYTEVTLPTGAKQLYAHDKPYLEDSNYIQIMYGPGGQAWTDSGWNGGNPDWQYGWTPDGAMIMRAIQAIKISADWIEGGVIRGEMIQVGGVGLPSVLDTTNNNISNLGDNLGLLGTDLSEYKDLTDAEIADLQASNEELYRQIMDSKQGIMNLVVNSDFGNSQDPSTEWWIVNNNTTWALVKRRYKTWGELKASGHTWGSLKGPYNW